MKLKRFLCLFFVVLLAVCIPCAFLAGCNGNSGDDGTDDTSNGGSNGDMTGTGDEIFTEGMTLAQLRAATENIDNFTVEIHNVTIDPEGKVSNYNIIGMFDDRRHYVYSERTVEEETIWIYESIYFTQDEYEYEYYYDYEENETTESLEKSLLTYHNPPKNYLWEDIEDYFTFTDGEAGFEIDDNYSNFQVTSSYVRLKGSVLEFGYTLVGKEGTSYEGVKEQYDCKIYGVNATVVDTSKVELADAEWADYVYYNGSGYRKAVDKDGNEYYFIEGSNSGAEPEKTINTLPVKPRES